MTLDPVEADVLSTALYVMGPEDGMSWVGRLPHVGVLFLEDRDGHLAATWNSAMEPWLAEAPPTGSDSHRYQPDPEEPRVP